MLVSVNVTQEHINKGNRASCENCPVALALYDEGFDNVYVESDYVEFYMDGEYHRATLPEEVTRKLDNYDFGCPMEPFLLEFELEEVAA